MTILHMSVKSQKSAMLSRALASMRSAGSRASVVLMPSHNARAECVPLIAANCVQSFPGTRQSSGGGSMALPSLLAQCPSAVRPMPECPALLSGGWKPLLRHSCRIL